MGLLDLPSDVVGTVLSMTDGCCGPEDDVPLEALCRDIGSATFAPYLNRARFQAAVRAWRGSPTLSNGHNCTAAPVSRVLRILQRGKGLNMDRLSLLLTIEERETLICAAAEAGLDGIVACLLSSGVRCDCRDGMAFALAAQNGHSRLVRMFMAWPTHPVSSKSARRAAFLSAVTHGHLEVVRILVDADPTLANMHNGRALVLAAMTGGDHIARYLLGEVHEAYAPRADCRNGDALVMACACGHVGMVETLLTWPRHAPFADCRNGYAVVFAATNGHADVVRLLLQYPVRAPAADCCNNAALVYAAMNGHEDVVRLLLDWPVHAPTAGCNEGEALLEAAQNGHVNVVRLLLERQHHPLLFANETLLAVAAVGGHVDVVRCIVEAAAGVLDGAVAKKIEWAALVRKLRHLGTARGLPSP